MPSQAARRGWCTRAAVPCPSRVARLIHEPWDDPMEDHAVEETVLSQKDEVVDGLGCILCIKGNDECAHIGLHRGGIGLRGIDDRGRCATPLRLLQCCCGTLWTAGRHRRCVCGCLRLCISRRTAGPRGNGDTREPRALLCSCVCQHLLVVRGKGHRGPRGCTRRRARGQVGGQAAQLECTAAAPGDEVGRTRPHSFDGRRAETLRRGQTRLRLALDPKLFKSVTASAVDSQ